MEGAMELAPQGERPTNDRPRELRPRDDDDGLGIGRPSAELSLEGEPEPALEPGLGPRGFSRPRGSDADPSHRSMPTALRVEAGDPAGSGDAGTGASEGLSLHRAAARCSSAYDLRLLIEEHGVEQLSVPDKDGAVPVHGAARNN